MNEALCPTCQINPATEPHPCPFQQEVNANEDYRCTCCPDCESDCAYDI